MTIREVISRLLTYPDQDEEIVIEWYDRALAKMHFQRIGVRWSEKRYLKLVKQLNEFHDNGHQITDSLKLSCIFNLVKDK